MLSAEVSTIYSVFNEKAFSIGLTDSENSPIAWLFDIVNLTIKEDHSIKAILESILLHTLENDMDGLNPGRLNKVTFKDLFKLEDKLALKSRLMLLFTSTTGMINGQFKRISDIRVKIEGARETYLLSKQKSFYF